MERRYGHITEIVLIVESTVGGGVLSLPSGLFRLADDDNSANGLIASGELESFVEQHGYTGPRTVARMSDVEADALCASIARGRKWSNKRASTRLTGYNVLVIYSGSQWHAVDSKQKPERILNKCTYTNDSDLVFFIVGVVNERDNGVAELAAIPIEQVPHVITRLGHAAHKSRPGVLSVHTAKSVVKDAIALSCQSCGPLRPVLTKWISTWAAIPCYPRDWQEDEYPSLTQDDVAAVQGGKCPTCGGAVLTLRLACPLIPERKPSATGVVHRAEPPWPWSKGGEADDGPGMFRTLREFLPAVIEETSSRGRDVVIVLADVRNPMWRGLLGLLVKGESLLYSPEHVVGIAPELEVVNGEALYTPPLITGKRLVVGIYAAERSKVVHALIGVERIPLQFVEDVKNAKPPRGMHTVVYFCGMYLGSKNLSRDCEHEQFPA